jgi:hypothetical protein
MECLKKCGSHPSWLLFDELKAKFVEPIVHALRIIIIMRGA